MTGEQLQDFSQLVTDLDHEPLFHMSLGSKELFHSNFLAWFVRSSPFRQRLPLRPGSLPATGRTKSVCGGKSANSISSSSSRNTSPC